MSDEIDPIVEEVRDRREAFAAKFNYDIRAMCEALRRLSEERGEQTVNLPARPVQKTLLPGKKAG